MQTHMNPINRKLTIPRPGSVVWLGRYHEHAIVLVILITLSPIGALWFWRGHLHNLVQIGLTALTVFLISGGARHFVLAPVTRWVKPLVVGSFRVIYFRSFREDQSYAARDTIAPILGCIGQLTTIHNPAYMQGFTETVGHDHSEDTKFAWLELGEILSDGLAAIPCEGDTWKREVQHLLVRADLAVIDVTVGGDNVAWERDQALTYLPENRVIAICAAGNEAPGNMDCIEYELSPKGRNQFRRTLRKRLSAIKEDSKK